MSQSVAKILNQWKEVHGIRTAVWKHSASWRLADLVWLYVQIDSRIVAVSFECRDTFQLPEDKKLRWWFREMFEPTKPVLPPRSPSEDEDHDHDLDENEDKDEAEEEENDEENSDDDDDQTSNAA